MASSPEASQSGPPPPPPPSPQPDSTPPPATPMAPASPPPPTPAATPPPSDSSASPPPPNLPSPTPEAQSPPLLPPPPPLPPADNSTPAAVFPPPVAPPSHVILPPPPPPPPPAAGDPTPPSHAAPSSSSSDNMQLAIILGIICGGVVLLVIVIVCLKRRQRKANKAHNLEYGFPPKVGGGGQYPKQMMGGSKFGVESGGGQYGLQSSPSPSPRGGGGKFEFSYEALAAATGGFSQANILGQGGFGLVHKGVLPNGQEVAVKGLKSGSGQGEREFQAEVEIISRVHHRHLVSLVGWSIAAGRRMLVYEFVPNGTLEYHLHKKGTVMDWAARRRIALGAAKGLAYLHEDCHPRIIHRDIKAANILIDFNFEAMVADFGLARLTTDNNTHVSTRVMGTFGYLAPEYASSGKLSEKSDVYSFGVMLLELITGRQPIDPTDVMEDSLVDWARPIITKGQETGDYSELVDLRLENNYNPEEMSRMISCAAASIRHSARRRPRMSQIVRGLDGNLSLDDDLNEGVKAGGGESTGTGENYNNPYDTKAYNADIMKFRMMVMSSDSGATNQSMGSSSS